MNLGVKTRTTIPFDSLRYFEKLKSAGVSEEQAKAQVDAMQSVITGIKENIKEYDEASRKDLATKGNIQDLRKEIQEVRGEVQDVRNELANTKHQILKWIVTAMLAQTALLVGIIAFLR